MDPRNVEGPVEPRGNGAVSGRSDKVLAAGRTRRQPDLPEETLARKCTDPMLRDIERATWYACPTSLTLVTWNEPRLADDMLLRQYLFYGELIVAAAWAWHAPLPANEPSNFSSLLTSQTRATFASILRYAEERPAAPDRPAAVHWLLQHAPPNGWEQDVISLAEQVLRAESADPDLIASARRVVILGLASRGEVAPALDALDLDLRSRRLRNPNGAIELCQSLAVRFQLRQERAAAEAVYDRLQTNYFLNPEVRDACDARKERLRLVGQPAPPLDVPDLDGRMLDWQQFQGQVVLVDFWATNCRPCLDELPRLKQLAREFRTNGVEILGISLDPDVETVHAFRQAQRLEWRFALDRDQVAPRFRVRLIPCLMVVDRKGNLVAVDVPPDDLRWLLLRVGG